MVEKRFDDIYKLQSGVAHNYMVPEREAIAKRDLDQRLNQMEFNDYLIFLKEPFDVK